MHAFGKLLAVPKHRKVGKASDAFIPNTETVLLRLLASTRKDNHVRSHQCNVTRTDNHVRSLGATAAAITRTIRRARHHQVVLGKCGPHLLRPVDTMFGLRLFADFFKKVAAMHGQWPLFLLYGFLEGRLFLISQRRSFDGNP